MSGHEAGPCFCMLARCQKLLEHIFTGGRLCMSLLRCRMLIQAGNLQADLDVEEDFHVPPLFQLATAVDELRLKDAAEEVLSLPDNARYAAQIVRSRIQH